VHCVLLLFLSARPVHATDRTELHAAFDSLADVYTKLRVSVAQVANWVGSRCAVAINDEQAVTVEISRIHIGQVDPS
jgi:hypothetical protein